MNAGGFHLKLYMYVFLGKLTKLQIYCRERKGEKTHNLAWVLENIFMN